MRAALVLGLMAACSSSITADDDAVVDAREAPDERDVAPTRAGDAAVPPPDVGAGMVVANAGPERRVITGPVVPLDGRASTGGDRLLWEQTAGPQAAIDEAATTRPRRPARCS
jgi:hypothetical protein